MFKETRAIEYSLEIIRILQNDVLDCKQITNKMIEDNRVVDISNSYIPKIIVKLARANLVKSTDKGYVLLKELNNMSMADILDILDMPLSFEPLYEICQKIKSQCANIPLVDIYEF